MKFKVFRVLLICGAGLLAGCAAMNEEPLDGGAPPDFSTGDRGVTCTDPGGDYDNDGIPNGQEGCTSGRDTDGDRLPDWQDQDSDGDKVSDSVEKGAKTGAGKCSGAPAGKDGWPCDSDGDRLPDYMDRDSDNDSLDDGAEDLNHDGLLGCCLKACNKPGSEAQKKCALNKQGCGGGQTCSGGACTPTASLLCSEGETDPRKKDTFGDGVEDKNRGTFICRDATESRPGRKPVQLKKDTRGDWHVALEQGARYGAMTITGAGAKVAAAAADHDKSGEEVAGFVLSMDSTTDVQDELTALVSRIRTSPPGGSATLTIQASGASARSHDRYPTVTRSLLSLKTSASSDVSTVRNQLVAAILGTSTASMSNLPMAFGGTGTDFTIRFTTVKRHAFKKDSAGKLVLDSQGNPVDTGDKTQWRLLVIGGVAASANYSDPKRRTGVLLDDLADGTALALASDTVGNECDSKAIADKPTADLLWVSDESTSMNDNRNDVVTHASEFFSRALLMGLDFRMGITNVVPPAQTGFGKFCSVASTNTNHSGGPDRFLLPTEQATFKSCIRNPPGYTIGKWIGEYGLINAKEALRGHLPRAANDQSKFRTKASIIIIVLTDQIPDALDSVMTFAKAAQCTLDATTQSQVNSLLVPYINLFSGSLDREAMVSRFLVLGGVCNNTCNAHVAHGYKELVARFGGQIGDVCQKNLSSTLQSFLDSIVASARPATLDYVPISSSLAVTVDGTLANRSRTAGFDYSPSNNSLVFIGIKYNKGSIVFASYKRWERQLIIK